MWSIGRIGEIYVSRKLSAISDQLSAQPGGRLYWGEEGARLLTDHVTLSPAEVLRMRARFDDKVLQMGHLEEDGSMPIPVGSVVEAVQSIGG